MNAKRAVLLPAGCGIAMAFLFGGEISTKSDRNADSTYSVELQAVPASTALVNAGQDMDTGWG
ncbi:hypothetical protein [Streptomyces sp. NPDC047985]|uniref:hypothetical protein n=1 Tax=unclassified Streptomyces TaxID=2593676 RepID=UPI00341397BB